VRAVLLLSLLLTPALGADWPDDPAGQRMRGGGEEERAAAEAIAQAKDIVARLESLRLRYEEDGDFARYAKDRDALLPEIEPRFNRLQEVREELQRSQLSQQMINALGMAKLVRGRVQRKGERDVGEAGARVVELSRSLRLIERVAAQKNEFAHSVKRDTDSFRAAEELDRRKRYAKAGLGAAAGVACAVVLALLLRRRRKP
jgi:hypothetical protein